MNDLKIRRLAAISIVKDAIEEVYGKSMLLAVEGRSRKRRYLNVRQAAFWILVTQYDITLELVAEHFNRTHATVLHAVKNVTGYIETDRYYYETNIAPLLSICEEKDAAIRHRRRDKKRSYAIMIEKWYAMGMYEELEKFTKKMESKVNNLNELIQNLEHDGYIVDRNPDRCYIKEGTPEDDLPLEMKILRNKYGFMIQTEIR